jgi:PTS system nitrogen regulatory IIA component
MPDSSSLRIRDVLDPRRVVLDVDGSSKREILARLVATLELTHPTIDRDALLETLLERERTSTTAIADGIAIPHGRHGDGDTVICLFGRSAGGVNFDSIDGGPTHLFFVLVSPEMHPTLHLRWLAHFAVLLRDESFRAALMAAQSADAAIAAIEAAERAHESGKAKP